MLLSSNQLEEVIGMTQEAFEFEKNGATVDTIVHAMTNPDVVEIEVQDRSMPEHKDYIEDVYRMGRIVNNRFNRAKFNRDMNEYNEKPRIYIHIKDENILQNFMRRDKGVRLTPNAYRQAGIIAMVLEKLGLPADTKVRWSSRAGCKSCPCSPGFIVQVTETLRKDVWVTVK